jgi:Flp pilus assembly protein CpaB
MTYRLRNIAIAIALAALAAMLTSFYVSQYKKDLKQGQEPTSVWVATEDIAEGTTGAEVANSLEKRSIAKEHVVPGAIVNPSDVADEVVTEKIYAGEQVTQLRFRSTTEQGVRATLTGTQRAIQVPGDEHQLLAGTLKEGDRVDVAGTWTYPEGSSTHYARTILRDILVVRPAVSTEVTAKITEGSGSDAPEQSVMLVLTDAQAQKLFWVMKNGEFSLELRPTDDPADSPESAEASKTLLGDGVSAAQLRRLFRAFSVERNTQ